MEFGLVLLVTDMLGYCRHVEVAIAEHAWHEQHQINWETAEVLDTSQHWYMRYIIDSWHIH